LPFKTIHKFTEFDEFHIAAGGEVRTLHPDIHVFRFEDIGKNVVKKMPVFRQSYYQIGLMKRADFKISYYEKQYASNRLNSLIIFKPGQLIQFSGELDWEGYVILFKEALLPVNYESSNAQHFYTIMDPAKESFLQLSNPEFEMLAGLYEKILHEYTEDVKNCLHVVSLYLQILIEKIQRIYNSRVAPPAPVTEQTRRKAVLVHEFKKLLQANLRHFKQVQDYADKLYITPKYLNQVITEHTGKSAKEHINELIIKESKTLLLYTEQSVADIAAAYNFTDQAHFSRFFRQHTAFSPLEFRNEHFNL
jgi:AraC family transcriptional regulator, transcriptional activator of pobA